MTGLLADENFEGHLRRIMDVLQNMGIGPFWEEMALRLSSVLDEGLGVGAKDRAVLAYCALNGWVLITGNRNHDGVDSLEAAIRDGVSPLPVFTLSDSDRLMTDRAFAEAVVYDLLDYLDDFRKRPDDFRRVGRLFLPKFPV